MKTKKLIQLGVVAALLTACLGFLVKLYPANAKCVTGIEGVVTDCVTETGLLGVHVALKDHLGHTLTGSDGSYNWVGLTAGDYTVVFTFGGLKVERSVTIIDCQMSEVNACFNINLP